MLSEMNHGKPKIFFPNLDGLRFLSFFIVFLTHGLTTDSPTIPHSSWYGFLKNRMFSDGEIGVSFFFVLSGFLISYLLLVEKKVTKRIDVKAFYIRRLLRIWPLYYAVVLFGFLAFPLLKQCFGQTPNEKSDPWLCFTFLNNFNRIYNGDSDASVMTIMWSVAIEEQFYLIWPLLFLLIPQKSYSYIFLIVIALSTIFRALYLHSTPIDWHTMGVISDMAIGGFAAYLMLTSRSFSEFVENMPKPVIVTIYLLTLLYIIVKHEIFASDLMQVLKRIFMATTFVFIILEQNFSKRSLFKISNWKIVSRLGKYTYGLYCLHGIAVLTCLTILRQLGLTQSMWQLLFLQLPLSLLLSIFISWISYKYFESWFLKLKARFSYIDR